MNIENLKQLKDWLMAGAPHAILSMDIGISDLDHLYIAELGEEENEFIQNQKLQKPDCGTVCCIAGAAQMMSHAEGGEIFPSIMKQNEILETSDSWLVTRDEALAWLGLEAQLFYSDDLHFRQDHFGHKLFSNRLAPDNCTPHQAAQAVQNVIDGKEPWEGIS